MRVLSNFTVAANVNNLNVTVTESAFAVLGSEWSQRNNHVLASRLYYVIGGSAEIWTDTQKITLKPGNLYFIPFNSSFSCDCANRLEKLFFHINIPFLDKLDIFENLKEILCIPYPDCDEMLRLYKGRSIESLTMLKTRLYRDIAHIMDISGLYNFNIPTYNSLTAEAIKCIERRLSSQLKVSDIALELSVSVRKLSALFSSEVGMSIGKYIANELLTKIKLCLISTDLSINEISDNYGFCDTSYFIRFFKKETGISPSKYRQKTIENGILSIAEDI